MSTMDLSRLSVCNPSPIKLEGPSLLHHLVKPPSDAPAIEYLADGERIKLSYRQLHKIADDLAQLISSAHNDQQSPLVVPLLLHQSPHLYTSLLAILKAGGTFCPLSIDAPPERVKFILKDVSARVVLATSELASKIPSESGVKVIQLDALDNPPTVGHFNHRTPVPDDLAYVMYTSGSTGTPKGVGISHSAVTQALLAHDEHIPVFTRFLQFAAPTFDVSVFETFFPLFRGSAVITTKREEMLDDLPKVIREMNVDACELTPTVAGSLLKRRSLAPNLRLLLTIGEMLKTPVIQEFGGSSDRESMLWAMYGPTEATIHCTLQTSLPSTSSTGNVGVPLKTVSCFVIKPSESQDGAGGFQILPRGEPGELAIGGHQLATGYINRPKQTSSAFIQTPFGRVYRTGDRAVVRDDGTIECLGRLSDGQVKLRGQRIELGEIAQAALRTPGCHAAVAAVVESTLICFCAVEQGTNHDSLTETCMRWLPQFMVPNEVVTMEKLPTLPSGKADVNKLKQDFVLRKATESQESGHAMPITAHDQEVIRLVSHTLKRPVQYESTLASVGIDSLLAIHVASVLRQASYHVTAVDLLKSRTVADLCAILQRQSQSQLNQGQRSLTSGVLAMEPIIRETPTLHERRKSVERIRKCTQLQSAMLAETLQHRDMYWNEVELVCPGIIPIQDIRQAFRQVIQHNDILRSGFAKSKQGLVLVTFKQGSETQVALSDQIITGLLSDAARNILEPFKVQLARRAPDNMTHVHILAHHAIYDGWSMDMILKDITQIINNEVPTPRENFQKVVDYHLGLSDDAAEDASRAYWTQTLRGWNKMPFPKLIGKPGVREFGSKRLELPVTIASVQEMSRLTEVSSQVIFQTALALVWQGVTGQNDIVYGSVLSGRTLPISGIADIIGPCIATAPLRIDFTNMHANIDIFKSIHASNRAAMEHCQLSLGEIGKLAGLQPNETLYDVLFVYQQSMASKNGASSLLKQTRHLDRLETKLLVEVEPHAESYALQMTYHSDSISAEFIDILCEQFLYTVQSLVHQPTGAIQASCDRESLRLSMYRELSNASDGPDDVAALFETSASRNPNADAICFVSADDKGQHDVKTVTYSELDTAANQIAHYLHSQEVGIGGVVAIVMNKSTLLYSVILGILKAGCAYLPILPSTPLARLCTILEQAQTTYCVIDEQMSAVNFPKQVKTLNIADVAFSSFDTRKPTIQNDPDRLSYVIYTSGTTGIPKGVAITQRNLASNVTYLSTIYPVSASRPRLLQACSHAFDVSVFEIFFAWATGMCLCSTDADTLHSNLERWIRDLHITHLSFTPTVASLVAPENVPEVEFLVTAGEPMTSSVRDKWSSKLWQGYGPSETTNICSVKQMTKQDNIEHLGWVFPNTSVSVMSPASTDILPRGWVGEFCFGGSQVAQGYLNDERLTTQKFVTHPKLGRVYRSGDLGRMLPDGSLIIMGRLDDQLKLRGQRIEANEINSILTGLSSVHAAVTMLVEPSQGYAHKTGQLATFYVPKNPDKTGGLIWPDIGATRLLFATLQSRVPPYMVPSYIVPVSHIPMTPSGKVDKSKLHKWFTDMPKKHLQSATAPIDENHDDSSWSHIEVAISEVIATLTDAPMADIARWTSFSVLGIDSISAIKVSGALNERLGTNVPISAILQYPCVAQLGRFLSQSRPENKNGDNTQVQHLARELAIQVKTSLSGLRSAIDDVLPCTPLQEAMLAQTKGSYCNKILLRLHVSLSRMKSYWEQMAQRHSILRTCFVTTNNSSYPIAQIILENWEIPWREYQVTVPSLEGATHEHLRTLSDPLDSMIPPYSLALIKYKESSFLSFVCHHALYDGVAMESLWREVEDLAHGRVLPKPVQYWPFLEQALSLPSDTNTFWDNQFRGYRPVTAFTSSTRSNANQFTHTTSLDIPLNEIWQKIRSMGISMLSLCQASWSSVLAVVYDKPDLAFGNVISGRTVGLDGIDRLVAPCFNTIPLRIDVSRSGQNIELAKAFQNLNSLCIPYQFSPLRLVQKLVCTQGQRLFDTLLLLQQPLKEMDTNIWTLEQDSGDMDVPVVCEVIPCPNLNSVVVNLHYDMDIITGDLASTIADMFKCMMKAIVLFPLSPVSDRNALPIVLTSQLQGLKVRRYKMENREITSNDSSEWSDLELEVRKVISAISGSPQTAISRQTTIFRVGLDSINAVQVASVLRSKGLKVSVSDVMECPSCAKLSARIAENSESTMRKPGQADFATFKSAVSERIKRVCETSSDIEAILPCTPVQNAMLAASLDSAENLYVNELSIDVDECANYLLTAWTTLRRRHPMLRTGFVAVQHQQSSFAMVRYTLPLHFPVEIIPIKESSSFDLSSWRTTSKSTVMHNVQQPPWKVVLVDGGKRTMMHVIIHHALYDGHSLDGMLDGLAGLLHSGGCAFPPIEPALFDLLSRSQDETASDRSFWEAHANDVVVNKFPVMTPLREQHRHSSSCVSFCSLDFESLQSQTRQLGVSIQAAIQAAWARLLASYVDETSVVFGITLSGRVTDDTESAPFPCLTTVPVIAKTAKSNVEMLESMMLYNSNLYKHQFTPLSHAQKWMGHQGSQIFDTLVVYQKKRACHPERTNWRLKADEGSVEYSLSLEVEPQIDQTIQFRVTARTDIVPSEQLKLILKQFDAILCHLVEHPNDLDDDLHICHMDLFSVTPAEIPVMKAPVTYVHQFVEEKALQQPDRPALEFVHSIEGNLLQTSCYTYKKLDEMGNKVANLLYDIVCPGDIVAIHFQKCPEVYFAILGILKAGCSFVALDTSAPEARKQFILGDSKASCVLTNNIDTVAFAAHTKIVTIDEVKLMEFSSKAPTLGSAFGPSSTCYCLYTSGTTGTPKGCEITHENVVQALMAFQDLFKGHWDSESRWLQFAALHFDVSVLEQYWSWSVGIAVVAATKELILDDLTGTIHKMNITHIDLTPSLARLTHPETLPNLCKGVFITGGEQLNQEILNSWGPEAVIYNAYGPTEATIGVTMFQRVPINGRPSNIGKQFPNVGSYIFRPGSETPVLRGGIGELCVSGKLVGKGYLHRPDLTNERFPSLSSFGERIYRTGDLVRILHDGCFEFLGRADDQVKLRGQRLEIGEINHTIRTDADGVTDAAAQVLSRSGKDVIVAFLVGKADTTRELCIVADEHELGLRAREACLDKLPAYMVPTYFVVLSHMPLSANNKVEAKQLKALFDNLSAEALMTFSNATPTDSKLNQRTLGIVTDALASMSFVDSTRILWSSSIFDLGIDSITSLQLSSKLKQQGFSKATPTTILRSPIVGDLVRALSKGVANVAEKDQTHKTSQAVHAVQHRHLANICRETDLRPQDIEYIAPCSSLQEGIISRAFEGNSNGAYFNSFDLKIHQTASMDGIIHAWKSIIAQHSILRTMFVRTTDGYLQVAAKGLSENWARFLSIDQAGDVPELLNKARTEWIASNDNHILTPLQFLFVQGPSVQQVRIHIFHGIYDGNSIDIMNRQAMTLYSGESIKAGAEFFEALLHGPLWNFSFCKPFWQSHLAGWRLSKFSRLDKTSDEYGTSKVVVGSRFLSMDALEEKRNRHNVTLQAVVLSSWIATLQTYLGAPLTVGIIVAGRSLNLPGVDQTVGPLFNTIPFHNKTLHGLTMENLVKKCHEFNTDVLAFQHVPLRNIQKWCSGGKPLFDNLFAFQIEQPNVNDDIEPWVIEDGPSVLDYDVAFEATKRQDGRLHVSLTAQDHILDRALIENLLEKFQQIVTKLDTGLILQAEQTSDILSTSNDALYNSENPDRVPDIGISADWTPRVLSIREELAAFTGISRDDIKLDTTVQELGIDSIDAIKISARLAKQAIRLTASQINQNQNLSSIANASTSTEGPSSLQPEQMGKLRDIQQALQRSVDESDAELDEVETLLPPTALQESMISGMLQSGFDWYFNHDVLQLSPEADVDRLIHSWNTIIQESPILRTGFIEVVNSKLDMAYCQVIFKKSTAHIQHLNIDNMSDLQDVIKSAKRRAIRGNATKDLLQVTLAQLESTPFMVLSVAHALYDGWSLGLLYDDLLAAYEGQTISRPSAETFIARSMENANVDAKTFWSGYLAHATPTMIPAGMSSAGQPSTRIIRKECVSDKGVSQISGFCKSNGISIQTLCMACWGAVAAHLTGTLDSIFGVVLSGRDIDGAAGLMFPTMNTVAIRTVLHGTTSSFLKYLEDTLVDVRRYQGLPLRKAQTAAGLFGRDLFNSLFILQKSFSNSRAKAMFRSIDGSSSVEYPVCVEAELGEQTLTWRIACQGGMFSEQQSLNIIENLEQALSFFMDSASSDTLAFDGSSVSVCGLPPMELNMKLSQVANERDKDDQMQLIAKEDWSQTTLAICQVLSEVSGVSVESISATSTLYHLGLDSISAIKVSLLLRKRNVQLKPRDLVQAQSLLEMGALAEQTQKSSSSSLTTVAKWTPPSALDVAEATKHLNIADNDIEVILPATPLQIYMMSAWQNSGGSVFYPSFGYELVDDVGSDEILVGWKSVMEKQPILRTRLVPTGSLEVPWIQVIAGYDAIRTGRVEQPLVRFHVERAARSTSFLICLSIHHCLYDGFSLPNIMSQFLAELQRKNSHRQENSQNTLSSWANFTISPTTKSNTRQRKEFWTEYLKGYAQLADNSDLKSNHFSRERVSYLRREAWTGVKQLSNMAADHGISVQSLALAAYAKSILIEQTRSFNGTKTVVFGVYLANRGNDINSHLDTCPTLNLVPLKVTISDGDDLVSIARTIQRDLHSIGTRERVNVGLWEIEAWTGLRIDTFINFLSLPQDDEATEEETDVSLVKLIRKQDDDTLSFDTEKSRSLLSQPWIQQNAVRSCYPASLDIEVSVHGGNLDIGIFASVDRLSHDEAPGMVNSIVDCLRALAE